MVRRIERQSFQWMERGAVKMAAYRVPFPGYSGSLLRLLLAASHETFRHIRK